MVQYNYLYGIYQPNAAVQLIAPKGMAEVNTPSKMNEERHKMLL